MRFSFRRQGAWGLGGLRWRRWGAVEGLGLFLTAVGLLVCASVKPQELGKQAVAAALGVAAMEGVKWTLRHPDRANRARRAAGSVGIGLLIAALLWGSEQYGAKSWLLLGPVSVQPSEIAKVCFVYVAMGRIDGRRFVDTMIALGYGAAVCVLVALGRDLGTAVALAATVLMYVYLRWGGFGLTAVGLPTLWAVPWMLGHYGQHAVERIRLWRRIWMDPQAGGYQQTRALSCMASAGIIGVGPGRGRIRSLFAADCDLSFALLWEEWGLFWGALTLLALAGIGFVVIQNRNHEIIERAAAGYTAGCLILVPSIMHMLGTVDLLPFTGIGLPFISNGGTAMVASWALLGFVAAMQQKTERGRLRWENG